MKKLIVVLAVATLLVAAPAAFGNLTKLKGKVKADTNSVVTAKSELDKNGTVKKLKGLKLANVDYKCKGGTTGETTVKFDSVRVSRGRDPYTGKYEYAFSDTYQYENDSGYFSAWGKSNEQGTRIEGRIKIYLLENPDDELSPVCRDTGDNLGTRFKAKK